MLTIIAFVINYKEAKSPYYVKNAILDFLICLIPIVNASYIFLSLCIFIIDKIGDKTSFERKKIYELLNKQLK